MIFPESLSHTQGLVLRYDPGADFDTVTVNGERFALIVDRSIQSLRNASSDSVIVDLNNYHIVVLDPVIISNLTLNGKTVTVINSLKISDALNITVPRDSGTIIFYGASINASKAYVTAKDLIQKGSRIVTLSRNINGQNEEMVFDYLQIVRELFQKALSEKSSSSVASAILKAGHEILFQEDDIEISRAEILGIWGIQINDLH